MALGTDVGSYHFSANKELYEIQRSNNFEFILDSKLNGLNAYGSDTKSFANAREFIRLSVSAASIPTFSQNVIEVRRGNTGVKYAGVISWDSGTLDVYDFIGAETLDILQAWQAKSGDPLKQTVGLQSDYKYDATLVEYTPDYSEVVRTWKLDGCWISKLNIPQLSQDDNGARKISATIEYDRAYIDYEI